MSLRRALLPNANDESDLPRSSLPNLRSVNLSSASGSSQSPRVRISNTGSSNGSRDAPSEATTFTRFRRCVKSINGSVGEELPKVNEDDALVPISHSKSLGTGLTAPYRNSVRYSSVLNEGNGDREKLPALTRSRAASVSGFARTGGGAPLLNVVQRNLANSNLATSAPLSSNNGSNNSSNNSGPALFWQGEPPKRFLVLRGSQVVSESELATLFALYYETTAMGNGCFTVEAIKAFIESRNSGRAAGTGADLAHLARFASALKSSLITRSSQLALKGKVLGMTDLFRICYPKASDVEIRFMQDSSSLVMSSQIAGDQPVRVLNPEEMRLATDAFQQLKKNDAGNLDVSELVMKLLAVFPDTLEDEPTILRQLQQAGINRFQTALNFEHYMKFLSVNLGSDIAISLDQFLSFLLGHEVLFAKAIRSRAGEAVNVQHVVEELSVLSQPQIHRPKSVSSAIKSLFHRK